jgi:hypothetical protein
MITLEEAWLWYESTQKQLRLMQRLGERYWDRLPWDGPRGKDDRFRDLDGEMVAGAAQLGLSQLDDLAVVVLFSVFESLVRKHVLDEMRNEVTTITHRSLLFAVMEAMHKVEEGSFFHVLEPFKDRHADLVEEVHQVRRYRNWVAHGKKDLPSENVRPDTAYLRLQRFLAVLTPSGSA